MSLPHLERNKKIIAKHPCFSDFTPVELDAFVNLFSEHSVKSGDIITTEGELVDSVYFIVEGKAEVRKNTPVAVLHPGEAIGLSDSGFYSTTGKRTATVVALTDMTLLRLALPTFYEFIRAHPHVDHLLHKNAEMLLRMHLIKHAAPFTKINMDRIHWLANHMTHCLVEPGKIIFQYGEKGEHCYLIQSGQIEIFLPHADGTETRLAILESPLVFGEASLLMDLPRNASARALTESQLLVLDNQTLSQITHTERDVATSLQLLLKTRSRPQRLENIESHTLKTADQEIIITLKDSLRGSYYRLSEQGWFLWQLLNGQHTIRDLAVAFNNKYGMFNPRLISSYIIDLMQAGFIEKNMRFDLSSSTSTNGLGWRVVAYIRKIMEASYSISNVDDWLSHTYRRYVHYLFTYPAFILMSILAIVGLILFVMYFHHYVALLSASTHSGWIIIAGFSAGMATVIIHELSHAYATKSFGHTVNSFGVGWFWIGPVAFCDTSSMWLATKWQRFVVDIIGLYVDLIIASIALILALFISQPFFILLLWLIALFNYLAIFSNLSPIIELDGYYALMDLLEKDNLRETSILWLIHDFPRTWKQPRLLLQHKAEFLYWVICIIYVFLQLIVMYIIMNILLKGLLGITNPFLALLSSLFIVVFSALSIWGEIRQTKNEAGSTLGKRLENRKNK